ncbi:Arm DNA-binding domain-containing protein [Pseudomonas sp. GT1P32]
MQGVFASLFRAKSWHLPFSWLSTPARISSGMYPELSLKEARSARDNALCVVAKGAEISR